MVLVEVVKLVVNVDWAFNVFLDLKVKSADSTDIATLIVVISLCQLGDLVTHDIQHYSDCQEDDTKSAEGEHSAHRCWHWPPCRKSLLLEL